MRYLIPIAVAWMYYLVMAFRFNWQPFNLNGISSILLLIIALFSVGGAIVLFRKNRKNKMFLTLSTGLLSCLLGFHILYLHYIDGIPLGSDVVSYFPYF